MTAARAWPPSVGILANPMSGRDVRRLAARASMTTLEIKRDQVARAAVGAVAAGARRIVVVRDPLRIACGALEHLELDAEREVLDVSCAELRAADSERAARALREAGCSVLVVLGGDGTNRAVARAWPDVRLVPLSTGTNNVFPLSVEATAAGAAAGLVAAGRVPQEVARAQKCLRVEIEGEADDLALIDAVRLVDDSVGNLMPFDAARIREVLLARAEPTAVGVSSLGGLCLPCGPADDFGVALRCGPHAAGGRPLLAPLAPGLFRTVHVEEVRKLALGERVVLTGPGVLAFDGDRERALAPGQRAAFTLRRDGPRVIDVARALALAAQSDAFFDRGHWHDPFDRSLGGEGGDCC